MTAKLTRALRVGCVGDDVFAAKRMVARYLRDKEALKLLARAARGDDKRALLVARTFGPYFAIKVNKVRRRENMKPTGVFDQPLLDTMRDFQLVDAFGDSLLERHARLHPPKPKLVEPKQGWSSLHRSLWEPYSIGRNMGLNDLGTYNPASTLPNSGGPSDHAVRPAMAFDLGFSPATGFGHPVAYRFFVKMIEHPAVEYVILGDRIWSAPRRSEGIRRYTAGGHSSHVHVSGWR